MIKYFSYILFLLLVAGCSNLDKNGYSTAESGLKFKLHTLGDGEREPNEGDIVMAQVVLKSMGDSVLYNSAWKHSGGITNFDFINKNGLNECFSLMRGGDSASFILNKTDDKILDLLGNVVLKNNQIKADILVREIFNQQEYKNWKNEMLWLFDKEMNEQLALKQYLDTMQLDEKNYISGIYYQELQKGKGKRPVKGNAVFIHYRAYFINGKEFDNTYGMDEPFVFNLGDPDQVIEGIETGLQLMRKKGKARFVIPSQLAFGEKGSSTGIVPPFSTLIYEVELINIM